jgi:hypothetical protein
MSNPEKLDSAFSVFSLRTSRAQTALGTLLIGAGIVVLLLRDELDVFFFHQFLSGSKRYALLIGLAMLGYGAAFLMLQYLRGSLTMRDFRDPSDQYSDPNRSRTYSVLKDRLSTLTSEIENLKSAQLGALSGNREQLIEALKPTIHSGLADEMIKRFGEQAENAARDHEIRNAFAAAQRRLQSELGSLSRRSNLNLVIGVITSAIAVGLLAYMVLASTLNFDSLTSVVAHYLPRLAIVVFIEVFSFFFLRLYRATLAEMRTYQTDLTALTVQFVAVQAALSAKNPDSASSLSRELLGAKSVQDLTVKEIKTPEIDVKSVLDVLQAAVKTMQPKKG